MTIGLLAFVDVGAQQAPDFQHAQTAVMDGDWDEAIHLIQPLLEKNPRDLKTINLMGLALTGKGNTAEANRMFQRALKIDPKFYAARKNLAINELHLNQLSDAEENFKMVLLSIPDDAVANMYAGELEFSRKDYAAAEAHLKHAGPWLDRDGRLHVALAECSFQLGNIESGIRELRAVSPERLEPASQFRAGYLLSQHDQYGDALKFFEAVHKQYPDSYDVSFNLAICYVETKRFAEAAELLSALREHGHKTSEVDNLLAEAVEGTGHAQQAYDVLREATQLAPGDERNYLDLAALCAAREAYDVGLEVVNVGLHYLPNSKALIMQRGVIYAESGKLDLAEKDFQAAADAERNAASVALGLAYLQGSEVARATDLLRQRVRDDPDNAALQYLLAESLIKSGVRPGDPDFTTAQKALRESVRLNSHFVYARVELAKTYLQEKKTDEAIAVLRAALEVDPRKIEIYAQLGNALRRKGETAEAAAMFAKVRELNEYNRQHGESAPLIKAGGNSEAGGSPTPEPRP